jgi:2-polyprenyl-6-methoxyphenol hydroxylase-like FAD-dependent oxidoreductase
MTRTELTSTHTPVLIVGAGPVGAVLALELARHDIHCLLIDRAAMASRHPKMDYLNGRSMELLRRLGLTEEIRSRGISPGHAFNFIWSRDFDEPPVAIWNYASVAELRERIATVNDGSVPVEPHQRLQGSLLEELLRQRVRACPTVDFREGWVFEELVQDQDGAWVRLTESATGTGHRVRARFVVACDGANSTVRDQLGVRVDELVPPTRHRDVYFRSTDPVLRRHGRAFLTIAAGGLTLVSRDEESTWTGTVHLPDEATRAQDPLRLMYHNLGVEFRVDEVLNITEWEGRLGVSEQYRVGSVFLAGDAAHRFYPIGGHGANTGIGDAIDLGWKLAASLRGWGGPVLLDSYAAERRPVALFNREACANLLEVWLRFPRLVANGASREQLAGFLRMETYQVDNLGVHFGYRYENSAVICGADAPAPTWEWGKISSDIWPGGRAPAVRLADGDQLFDRFGPGFTVVDFSGTGTGRLMASELAGRGVPTAYLPLSDHQASRIWRYPLVLIRPDQHVAWRGTGLPPDMDAVLDKVTGVAARRAAHLVSAN